MVREVSKRTSVSPVHSGPSGDIDEHSAIPKILSMVASWSLLWQSGHFSGSGKTVSFRVCSNVGSIPNEAKPVKGQKTPSA